MIVMNLTNFICVHLRINLANNIIDVRDIDKDSMIYMNFVIWWTLLNF